ncbi:hypothetical protein F4804DRAFT_319717 [Jackrogersella minutella]|nr:hypothetical protein F4804DRAFT_319717 [Jackrogersella minutella]
MSCRLVGVAMRAAPTAMAGISEMLNTVHYYKNTYLGQGEYGKIVFPFIFRSTGVWYVVFEVSSPLLFLRRAPKSHYAGAHMTR